MVMLRCLSFSLVLATLVATGAAIQKRGVIEEAGKLFHGLQHGFGHLRSELRPWADQLEREVGPAMETVEKQLGTAFDRLGQTFSSIDRSDPAGIGSHDMHTGGMPGLSSMLNPFSMFGMSRQNWWEGPNVCIDRQVSTDDSEDEDSSSSGSGSSGRFFLMDTSFTSCRNDVGYRECTTQVNRNGQRSRVTVRHQCCHGYARTKDGETGCAKADLEDLESTLRQLQAVEFVELLDSSGAVSELSKNLTVFAPSDDAIEDFRHDLQHLNSLDEEAYTIDGGLSRRRRDLTIFEAPSLAEIMRSHMVAGLVDTADMQDDSVVASVNGHAIRLTVYNTYPQKAIMANCAKVTSRDHYATNGVVHVVDKVVVPATRTIAQMVATDVQFARLRDVLAKADMMDMLDGRDGQWTLFAPTNDAFDRLDKDIMAKIERGSGCSRDILMHHVLPNVICTGVVENKAKTANANGKYLVISRSEDDELVVDDESRIVERDIVASNGVLHVVDRVLVPEAARSLADALGSQQLRELFAIAGLLDDGDALSNVTVFAPSDKAMSALPQSMLDELKADPAKLKDFLLYHVAEPKTCRCDMKNKQVLDSLRPGHRLRVNTYSTGILSAGARKTTVQCAVVTGAEGEVCGGLVHTVDKVLMPPMGSVVDILRHDARHGRWADLVRLAELEGELADEERSLTVLAPTDAAFDDMDPEAREAAFADKVAAARVVRHHVLGEAVCCAGIARSFAFFDQSTTRFTLLEDDVVSLRRSGGGYLYADTAELTTCDMVATNGVVHAIDRVLLPAGMGPSGSQTPAARRRQLGPLDLLRLIGQ